jgi:hypothetical protein
VKPIELTSRRLVLSLALSASIGLLLNTASPVAVAITGICPVIWLIQRTRSAAYATAVVYYAAALWPVIPCARAFADSVSLGPILWIFGALCLGLPWLAFWTENRRGLLWRAPLAGLIGIAPPLGIIALASPVAAAGYLFPSLKLIGIAVTLSLPGLIAFRPVTGTSLAFVAILTTNLAGPKTELTREIWQGMDLVGEQTNNSFTDFKNLEFALRTAAASHARVIVFPEATIRCWTPTAAAFFEQSVSRLAARKKTLLIGAIIPSVIPELVESNLLEQLNILVDRHQLVKPSASLSGSKSFTSKYRNAVIAIGADSATFDQRIPVPIGMWHPFSDIGVPLNLGGAATLVIAGERAAMLICYEQLIVWPALVSTINQPTMLVGIANEQWVKGTTVPRLQRTYLQAWARLIGVTPIHASTY